MLMLKQPEGRVLLGMPPEELGIIIAALEEFLLIEGNCGRTPEESREKERAIAMLAELKK